jgi:DNA-binding LacI/PurR family transcriptional regulator
MSLPLYQRIFQDLSHQIARGQLRQGQWVGSESELMARYLVSRITARNALNALVDQGLVVRIPGKGSFVAGRSAARRPSGDRPDWLCAIFPTLTARVEQAYLAHLEQACSQQGLRLTLRCTHESSRRQDAILGSVLADGASGVLLFPTVRARATSTLRLAARRRQPVVLLDRYLPEIGLPAVTSDNLAGGALAARHLLNLVGPQAAILHFPLGNSAVTDRHAGFRHEYEARFHQFGAPQACLIDDSRVLATAARQRIEAVLPVIAAHLARFPELAGVFAANAEIAQIAYYAARQQGLAIGHDFHIVSFDQPYLPGVPYIRQDLKQVIATAVAVLRSRIAGDDTTGHQVIPVTLARPTVSPSPAERLSHIVMGVAW